VLLLEATLSFLSRGSPTLALNGCIIEEQSHLLHRAVALSLAILVTRWFNLVADALRDAHYEGR